MDEFKYKKLMWVFVGLFIVSVGLAGYFGYIYYQNRNPKILLDKMMEGSSEELSTLGTIKSKKENSVVLESDAGEFEAEYSANMVVRIKKDENTIEDATTEDIKEGQSAFVVYAKQTDDINYIYEIVLYELQE